MAQLFSLNDNLLFSFFIVDVTMRVLPNLYSSTASGPPSPLFGKEERRL